MSITRKFAMRLLFVITLVACGKILVQEPSWFYRHSSGRWIGVVDGAIRVGNMGFRPDRTGSFA
jgi:hypothetical protein